jgi:hypothetical protein
LCFITSHIEGKTDNIFNNSTNAALPHYSPDLSSSKSAESFYGRNLLNEDDFLHRTPAASASVVQFESLPNALTDPEQIKAPFESEVKRKENCQNQQEKQKYRNRNGNLHKNFSCF